MGTGAAWYYMSKGWMRKTRRIGPITEADLLMRIDSGKIVPDTLLQSEKTKGKWVPMSDVRPAMKRWKQSHPQG